MSAPVRFDRFELLPAERRLLADGEPVELGARALDLLCVLVANAGRLVSKEELLDAVWAEVVVEEANLHVQVSALRKVLGREAIATVPGRGYQFVRPLRRELPAPSPQPQPPSGLPRLLGREAELRRLRQQVEQSPLVTVTGAGGSGKTLLARHLLHALQGWRPQGEARVELLEVPDAAALPQAVAGALGLESGAGSAQALARALRGSDRLLVLDNAEHLLPAVRELVQALRDTAPEVRLLVTSQAPLKLPGEARLALRGLAVPAWPCSAADARGFAAVALFAERARQADRRFRLDDTTVADVVAIGAALDGSALGVQLAASLLGMRPLAEVRRRLVPDPAAGGPPEPTKNVLRAALAWSHGLLDEASRRVFRRLAVALGALPLPLLVGVAGDEQLDATAVADALADLVDRSFVEPEPAEGAAPLRYRLLDSPRTLALEALQASGEAPALQARLGAGIAALARQAHHERMNGGPPAAAAIADAGWPAAADVRAALHWALAHDLADAAVIAQSSAGFQLPAAERLACAARLAEGAAGLPAPAAGQALLAAAVLTRHSDLGRRHALMLQAAEQFARAGLPRERYYALARAGEAVAISRVELAEAVLAQARALEDPAWPASLRRVRAAAEAQLASGRGDFAASLVAHRHALALERASGEPAISVLVSLADVEIMVGEGEAAAAHLHEAAELARRRGLLADRWAFILANLTAARLVQGDLTGARQTAAEGWPQARRFDADAWWADHLALLAAREGRMRTAALLLGLADAAYVRIRDGRQPLETRHAAAAAEAARPALGAARFAALRRAGAVAEAEARVHAAALAADDAAWD
jgi:predicted ATPase/DNA-binding winged helix-turn-helix (wHTH) protein